MMSHLGVSALQALYQEYLDVEVTYSKEVVTGLGQVSSGSSLKCQGDVYPCLVHSCSFRKAILLLRLPAANWKVSQFGTKLAVLTLMFLQPKTSKKELFQFNGSLEVVQENQSETGLLSIMLEVKFSHRPPEGFLQVQGSYLTLRKETHQRKEARITVNTETMDLLGLTSSHSTLVIDHIERKCLIRDLSYQGARVILTGVANFLLQKPFELTVPIRNMTPNQIPGQILRAEPVPGHRGLAIVALGYHNDRVPIEYLRVLQKGFKLGLEKQGSQAPVAKSTEPKTSKIDLKTFKLTR
jgi:hypothetical protein